LGEITARYGIVAVIGNDQRTNLITEVIQKLEKENVGLQFASGPTVLSDKVGEPPAKFMYGILVCIGSELLL